MVNLLLVMVLAKQDFSAEVIVIVLTIAMVMVIEKQDKKSLGEFQNHMKAEQSHIFTTFCPSGKIDKISLGESNLYHVLAGRID